MKKFIYLILLVLSRGFIIAQGNDSVYNNIIQVTYYTYMDKGVPLSRESELLIDHLQNESVYRTDYHSDKILDSSSLEAIAKETNNLFKIKTYFQFKDIFISNSKGIIISIDWLANKKVRYEEPIPKFNWKLSNETKFVNNYICHKAEVDFRGRKYIAWYTKEIALPFGPWKFYGLPGLILEVQDSDKEYTIFAKEIKFNSQKNIYKIAKTDLVMTLQEFVSKEDELYNSNNWEIPGIKISQDDYIRDAMELIYEWEEEAKK